MKPIQCTRSNWSTLRSDNSQYFLSKLLLLFWISCKKVEKERSRVRSLKVISVCYEVSLILKNRCLLFRLTVSIPAINMSIAVTMASFGAIPRMKNSSRILGSSSESAGRCLAASKVFCTYLTAVLPEKVWLLS